jgi:hypothetical protein
MKNRILALTCLLALAASCTPMSEQPTTLATATPEAVAIAPMPSETPAPTDTSTPETATPVRTDTYTPQPTEPADTPTPKSTATWTRTNTPMPTDTATATLAPPTKTPKPTRRPPTATPKPTETPRPQQIIFQDDFSHGINIAESPNAGFYYMNQGAAVEVIDDPTNSERGKVLKCFVSGDSKLEPSGNWVRRGYLTWTNTGGYYNSEIVPVPAAVQSDVYLPEEMVGNGSREKPSISLMSFHVDRIGHQPGQEPDFAAGFDLGSNGAFGYMNNRGEWITLNTKFYPDRWYTLRLVVEPNGDILPYVNGKLALPSGKQPLRIPDGYEIGFGDGHGGLYSVTGKDPTPDFPQGAWLLNDDFKVIVER